MPDMMTDLVIIGPIKNAKLYFAPSQFLLRNNDLYSQCAPQEHTHMNFSIDTITC